MENNSYSKEQWWDEMQYIFRPDAFCGKHERIPGALCNLPCPDCGALGYYGPKLGLDSDLKGYYLKPDEPDFVFVNFIIGDERHILKHRITRKYRCCKWCGLLQEAWGKVLEDDPRKANSHFTSGCLRRHKKCGRREINNGIELDWATFYPEGVQCKDCGENVEQFVPKDDSSYQEQKERFDKAHRRAVQ